MTLAQHAARIPQAGRAKIGLQQSELHQVELRAASVDAFDLAGNRLERGDRSEEIAPLENQRKRVTPPERGGPIDGDRCARVRRFTTKSRF